MTEDHMHQMEQDNAWLKASVNHLMDGQSELRHSMQEVATLVIEIAEMRKEFERVEREVEKSRERYHDLANCAASRPCDLHRRDIDRLEVRANNHSRRLDDIENALPTLKLSSNWVFKALLAACGLLATISVGIILHAAKNGGL